VAEKPEDREPDDEQPFTVELLWAAYGSLVIVGVVAVLSSHIGRGLEDDLDAPARTLVAVPVVVAASVVFGCALLALIVPQYRRSSLRVAEIAGWLIPAWLVMAAMVLLAIQFALDHAD
jgi:predicted Co/Zn/Cd cation transporter (cation efflux family)